MGTLSGWLTFINVALCTGVQFKELVAFKCGVSLAGAPCRADRLLQSLSINKQSVRDSTNHVERYVYMGGGECHNHKGGVSF